MLGAFHQLPVEMKCTPIDVAMKEKRPSAKFNQEKREEQHKEKMAKDQLKCDKMLEKATNKHTNSLCCFDLCNSKAHWKTVPEGTCQVRALPSKTAKLDNLNKQIEMRTVGLGWEDLGHNWSKDCKAHSPDDLVKHLKHTTREESRRDIPTAPPVDTLTRKPTPKFGSMAADVAMMDKDQFFRAKQSGHKQRWCTGKGGRKVWMTQWKACGHCRDPKLMTAWWANVFRSVGILIWMRLVKEFCDGARELSPWCQMEVTSKSL